MIVPMMTWVPLQFLSPFGNSSLGQLPCTLQNEIGHYSALCSTLDPKQQLAFVLRLVSGRFACRDGDIVVGIGVVMLWLNC